ncbi:hypothetical protein [Natrarchaeobaculum aegyptiacum]|uniref:Uncharacterized protein n=1 Tax=Natrarchaeobaculum aegyptiacum TaxID=745377 RepID=A0A2Z2HXD5_9EURY|nr:hypothetical protein [Natrarchaeobaculum aegyptiacum]ARS89624.1 hypothetical protein B1756_07660 [Natrarchaeobaculum aegyptiacum]
MSTTSTVEVSQIDGQFEAVDSETGVVGEGSTRVSALNDLVGRLLEFQATIEDDPVGVSREVRERTQRRFEEKGIEQDEVERAIEWAR